MKLNKPEEKKKQRKLKQNKREKTIENRIRRRQFEESEQVYRT